MDADKKAPPPKEIFENGGEEVFDDPDGILKKKKKNKNKVAPSSQTVRSSATINIIRTLKDVVTSEDEKGMAMKRVLELEKELLDMRSSKNESEEEVKGLKYELGGLQKNFKELKDSSAASLEELEKFEVTRLSDENEALKKENTDLMKQVENSMTQQIADQKECELLKTDLKNKTEEMKVLKLQVDEMKSQLLNSISSNNESLQVIEEAKKEIKQMTESMKQKEETLKQQITQLENDYKAKEDKINNEKDSLLKELNEEREKVKVNNSEIKVLKNGIEKLIKEKTDEKSFRIKIAERLKMIIEEKNTMEGAYKLDLQQVSRDFEDLKKHFVHVTSDKAEMFQKLSDAVFEKCKKQRWVPDIESENCTNCCEKFSFTLRRHHCRMCGHIFCFKCSDRWLLTPHSSKRVRACDVCADTYTEQHLDAEPGRDIDMTDAPPQQMYRELRGEEITKYEKEYQEDEDAEDDGGPGETSRLLEKGK
eukprot:TCONS_00068255-protein